MDNNLPDDYKQAAREELQRREAAQQELIRRQMQEKQQKEQSIFGKYNIPEPPEDIRNVLAGVASGAQSNLKSISDLKENLLKTGLGVAIGSPGLINAVPNMGKYLSEKIDGLDLNNILGKESIDPYKALDVKEQHFLSRGGAEQALGEYGPMAFGIGKLGFDLLKKLPTSKLKSFISELSSGKSSLTDVGKQLAENIKNKYNEIKSVGKEKYEDIFKINNVGDKSIIDVNDPYNIGKKNIVENQNLFDKHVINKLDPSVKDSYDVFKNNPTVRNLHTFQSELGNEERYYEKMINRGEATGEEKQLLQNITNSKNKAIGIINQKLEESAPGLSNKYGESSEFWAKNVRPYLSDKNLREIVKKKGGMKNPSKEVVRNIFKNPEEDTEAIISHLGDNSVKDILYKAMGKQARNINYKNFPNLINKLDESGFERYVTPEMRTLGESLEKYGRVKSKALQGLGLGTGLTLGYELFKK